MRRSSSVSRDVTKPGSFLEAEAQKAELEALNKRSSTVNYEASEKSTDSEGDHGDDAEQIKSSAKLKEDIAFSKQLTISNAKSIYNENISAAEIYQHFKENKDLEFDQAIVEQLISRE